MNIDDLISGLQRQLAELGDGGDCHSATERTEWYTATTNIARVISGLRNAPADLERAQGRLDAAEADKAAVIEKQAALQKELLDAPDPQTIRNGRERDAEYTRQQSLRRQLQRLNEGTLLKSPTETYRRLADLDARMTELTDRRNRAQMTLDAHIAEAEKLLAEQPVSR
jgi:hypothetical protein